MQNIIKQAEELLAKCEEVSLASINEEGYPRICIMAKVKSEGIGSIWMATGTNSKKTGHFEKNPKSSVCFYKGGDSVTLIGQVEVVRDSGSKKAFWQDWFINHFPGGPEDPDYCLLRFYANEATCWINGVFEAHRIDQ